MCVFRRDDRGRVFSVAIVASQRTVYPSVTNRDIARRETIYRLGKGEFRHEGSSFTSFVDGFTLSGFVVIRYRHTWYFSNVCNRNGGKRGCVISSCILKRVRV